MTKIKDDVYEIVENDIEKIQVKPGQTIGNLGSDGAMHLTKELCNNAWDEVTSPNAIGKHVIIHLNEAKNEITVSDDSRGIPFNIVEQVCTIIASSTKFYRDSSQGSAGENGTGMKACTALSEKFVVTVEREGQKCRLTFKEGKKISKKVVDSETAEHGSTFSMIPSKMFLGKDCKIVPETLKNWVEKIHYLLPNDVKTTLIIDYASKEASFKKTFKNKNGLFDYCKTLTKTAEFEPIHLSESVNVKEMVMNRRANHKGKLGEEIEADRFLGIEFAFTMSKTDDEYIQDSFCNMVNTFQGGVHIEAVKYAICQYLAKAAKQFITKRDSEDLNILPRDAENGLVLTCNLSTNINPQFMAQIKSSVGNKELFTPIKNIVTKCLIEHFEKYPAALKRVCDLVKLNAKARLAVNKAKNSIVKPEKPTIGRYNEKNIIACNIAGIDPRKEIYIVEGESAGSDASRYSPAYQTIIRLKGFPYNAVDQSDESVNNNYEWNAFFKELGCGMGDNVDVKKCRYGRIIFSSDADADGYGITSYCSALTLFKLQPLVEAGMIYKVYPPLYQLKGGKFIKTKREFLDELTKVIGKKYSLETVDGHKFTTKEFYDFIEKNRDYLETLNRIAKQFSIHPDIVEFIAVNCDKPNLEKAIAKQYKELSIDGNVIQGVYNDKYQILIVDKEFKNSITPLLKYIQMNNGVMEYNLITNSNKEKTLSSLGEVFRAFDTCSLDIEKRIKGLGEISPHELRDTIMDPSKRHLVRLTIKDVEEAKERFRLFHSDKEKYVKMRKEKYGFNSIDPHLLDN